MGSIPKKLGSKVRHILNLNATQNQPFEQILNVLNFNPHLGFAASETAPKPSFREINTKPRGN